jgi:hypothetical protein
LGKAGTAYFRFSFTAFQLEKTHADEDAGLSVFWTLESHKMGSRSGQNSIFLRL